MKYFLKAIFNVNLEFFIWLENNETSLNVSFVRTQLHLQELNTDGVKGWRFELPSLLLGKEAR